MTTVLDRLRAANPVPNPDDLTEGERASAERALRHALAERGVAEPAVVEPAAAPAHPRRRMPARRRVLAPVGLGIAVGAAVVLALVTGLDSGTVQPPRSQAAVALDRAASAADRGRGTAADLQPGQALYVRERNEYMFIFADADPGAFTGLQSHQRETWTDLAGTVHYVERFGASRLVGARDRARWEAAGRPPLSGARPGDVESGRSADGISFGNEQLTFEQLAAKPTDGRAMYDEIKRANHGSGPTPDEGVFQTAADLLRSGIAPAEIRAALYRALAYVKGIRFAGTVKDPEGREGLAVELTAANGIEHQLIFDPETSRVLAEQDVLVTPNEYVDTAPGTVLGYRVVLQTAVVDRLGERP